MTVDFVPQADDVLGEKWRVNGRHGSLRVLQVIPSVSLVHGGPSRAVRLIGRALRGQGVATEIATTDDEDQDGGPNVRWAW